MSTDGQWSAWQSWSSCTDTCGERSVKHRLRLCNNPVSYTHLDVIRNRVTNLLHHFTSLVRNADKFSALDQEGGAQMSNRRRLSDPTVDNRTSQTEMQVSMQTQSTRLSAEVAIPFVQPTTTQSNSKSATPSGCSFAEPEQDFEYDYYEAPIEGSILNPAWSY
ncbi:hypothetical protein T4E_925 [Trichinella pseudospiralis]|uniref:Uncharacterized protein n=1 Tax=Trichinella pseudospiralis TaxID=6337 RepID=A0A0V0Y674_TRIPS|nr:hypothetical protein T4E_925 [Trichinella pseudospiralis]